MGAPTLHELGEGKKFEQSHFTTTRAKCLYQVYLRSPPLPLAVENVWEHHKWAFAKRCSEYWKVSTGTKFLKQINLLIAELGVHYEGHESVKAKLRPQDKAWLKNELKQSDQKRAFEDFVVGLAVWLPHSMMNLPTG